MYVARTFLRYDYVLSDMVAKDTGDKSSIILICHFRLKGARKVSYEADRTYATALHKLRG